MLRFSTPLFYIFSDKYVIEIKDTYLLQTQHRIFKHMPDHRLLELLSQTFSSISTASTEIINLEAILNLPKGTEHFIADLHGEYEAFNYIVRNASGNIKRKVTELFGHTMREQEIRQLCALIYYPEKKLPLILDEEDNIDEFYHITIHRLISVTQAVSSKYTRSKVRKALPKEFAYIIEELLHESPSDEDKDAYFTRIIETIISTGQAYNFIVEMCRLIQKLSIDHLHILGDIFDRGPGAHLIMDDLCERKKFDIQWGNHDIVWMGAAAGNDACIANVLRLSLRYANMAILEDGYGINLLPLATFAMNTYGDDPCTEFMPKITDESEHIDVPTQRLYAKMHKAIAIIQFKLEGNLIKRYPEWEMGDRNLLEHIDTQGARIYLPWLDKTFALKDTSFPTVNPDDPYALTAEEEALVNQLRHSFKVSDKFRRHINCLISHGALYNVSNSNLLFHAAVPLTPEGEFQEVEIKGKTYKGKALYDYINWLVRSAFLAETPETDRPFAIDYFWYLWCGPLSPLFNKQRMTTFERYFIADKETHAEEKGDYYTLRNNPEVCDRIMDEFGATGPYRHIINGHVPVRVGKGENPIKADGRLMVIDGGFSKAYHSQTGIAGYTLVYHSTGFQLVQHEPFTSVEEVVRTGADIAGSTTIVELSSKRIRVRDTDKGKVLISQINELKQLLSAFRNGHIKERKI